jgi:hypothetical protein
MLLSAWLLRPGSIYAIGTGCLWSGVQPDRRERMRGQEHIGARELRVRHRRYPICVLRAIISIRSILVRIPITLR